MWRDALLKLEVFESTVAVVTNTALHNGEGVNLLENGRNWNATPRRCDHYIANSRWGLNFDLGTVSSRDKGLKRGCKRGDFNSNKFEHGLPSFATSS